MNKIITAIVKDMNYNTIIFDVGFTLITFENFTLKKYFDTLDKGLDHMSEFLLNENIIRAPYTFKKNFKKFRNQNFQNSLINYKEITTEKTLVQTLNSLNLPSIDSALAHKAIMIYHSTEGTFWKARSTAKPVLETLHKKFKLGVLSNAPYHNGIIYLLDTNNLSQYFEIIVSSAQIGFCKPDKRTFEYILEKVGSMPEQSIMIGDDLKNDIYGAQQLGMKTILIKKSFDIAFNNHSDVIPDAQITDLPEIIPIIHDWNNS
ncbi:MAG TPA: HAD family hydrolase [Candidatus Deferrimicrobium sp.]|nr:HAD family hydrolase [Candidatus Deferrimicrobium sp.]